MRSTVDGGSVLGVCRDALTDTGSKASSTEASTVDANSVELFPAVVVVVVVVVW